MKRAMLIVAQLILLVVGIVVYSNWHRASSDSPEVVVRETFLKANEGLYGEATSNLVASAQGFYAKEPGLAETTWEVVTRNRTIADMSTRPAEIHGNAARVTVVIQFEDGAKEFVHEELLREKGAWKLLFWNTLKKLAPRYDIQTHKLAQVRYNLAASKVKVANEPTKLPRTPATVRLPTGCEWSPKLRAFEDRVVGTAISGDFHPFLGRVEVSHRLAKFWQEPNAELRKREEVLVGKNKGTLFDIEQVNAEGKTWRQLILLLGNDEKTLQINGDFPQDPHLLEVVRDSLMTVEWNP